MNFLELVYSIAISLCVIVVGSYIYGIIYSNNNTNNENDDYDKLRTNDLNTPTSIYPIQESIDGTTPLIQSSNMIDDKNKYPYTQDNQNIHNLTNSTQFNNNIGVGVGVGVGVDDSTELFPKRQQRFGNGAIPISEASRNQTQLMGEGHQSLSILGNEPEFEPVQHMMNPIPNDRLMPINGAKDDPIKSRLDSIESMGLYNHILEKDMGQYNGVNKNKFFEMEPRDSAYHLYDNQNSSQNNTSTSNMPNSFQQQQQFNTANRQGQFIDQPKHPNFDLGFQINYKELDHNNSVSKNANNLYTSILTK